MKQFIVVLIILLFMSGCVYFHEDGDESFRFGLSTHKYRDCVEYYDAAGVYHKECNKDIINYGFSPNIKIKVDKSF